AYSAEDDYGLGVIELVWRVGDAPEARRTLQPRGGAREAQGKLEWDLGELSLKPGAKVAYHVEARDNDTVPGPNVGRSRTLYLTVSSPRERTEQALKAAGDLEELALQLLGDRLEVPRGSDEALLEALG